MSSYDFRSLYSQADNSIFIYDAGEPDAVVEAATWGRTKDGTKGQWDVRFRVSTGPNAGRIQLRKYITISADKPQSLGIMFRQLKALGIPVPDEHNPQQQPFWALGWTEDQVAQAMVGRPVMLKIAVGDWEGIQRNDVRDIRPPRPGAPTTWPQWQQQQPAAVPGYGQPQYGPSGFAPPAYPGGPAAYNPMAADGYGQQQQPQYQDYPTVAPAAPFPAAAPQYSQPQYQQPQYPAAPQPYGSPQQPPAAPAPAAPWQQPQGAPAQNGGQPGGNPAVPPWAQPPTPGAGGVGEFTAQGQSQQPSVMQPQFQQPQGYGVAPAPYQPQQPGAQPAPAPGAAAPPWNGGQSTQWNGQQPPAEPTGPQGTPPPPWAQ